MTDTIRKTVCIVGAFDRFNYGDLLFPHISAHLVRSRFPQADISFHALRACDLTEAGGVPVSTQKNLYKRLRATNSPGMIWIAGGGVLSSSWVYMHLYLLEGAYLKQYRRLLRHMPSWIMEILVQRFYRVPNKVPMAFDPLDFGSHPPDIVYNAVGGRSLRGRHPRVVRWIRSAWSRSTWLTVRDDASRNAVIELQNSAPHMSPDSAVIMRTVYDDAILDTAREQAFGRSGASPERPYVCVQIRAETFQRHRSALTEQIRKIGQEQNRDVVLFTIGRAAGHEDQIAQNTISAALANEPWLHVAPLDTTVPEIMAIIAGSACYVGTSLHGFITAFAHAVPRVGLDQVEKLTGFRDAWDMPTMPADCGPDELADAVDTAIAHDRDRMAAIAQDVAARYEADVKNIWQAIDDRALEEKENG